MFGGGSYRVPLPLGAGGPLDFLFGGPPQRYRDLPVCVVDVASPFDSVCQELGHAYGLEHPLDAARDEYGDPYDAMAAAWYGGAYSPAFLRPVDPTLPVGALVSDVTLPDGTKVDPLDPQRVIGPYASAAHLTQSPFAAALGSHGFFVTVPPSYAGGAHSFTLHALDRAIAEYPVRALPIVAVIPPAAPGDETYFLELRRARGYDAGLRQTPAQATRPPIGIVPGRTTASA